VLDHGPRNQRISDDIKLRPALQAEPRHPSAVVYFQEEHESAGPLEGSDSRLEVLRVHRRLHRFAEHLTVGGADGSAEG
jgi:hypothetical protein